MAGDQPDNTPINDRVTPPETPASEPIDAKPYQTAEVPSPGTDKTGDILPHASDLTRFPSTTLLGGPDAGMKAEAGRLAQAYPLNNQSIVRSLQHAKS